MLLKNSLLDCRGKDFNNLWVLFFSKIVKNKYFFLKRFELFIILFILFCVFVVSRLVGFLKCYLRWVGFRRFILLIVNY